MQTTEFSKQIEQMIKDIKPFAEYLVKAKASDVPYYEGYDDGTSDTILRICTALEKMLYVKHSPYVSPFATEIRIEVQDLRLKLAEKGGE